jgi:hypothetical protein
VQILGGAVRIPEFNRCIDVKHAMVVTPLNNLGAIDVPGQVDKQVPRGKVATQQQTQVIRPDSILHKRHALPEPWFERGVALLKVHDGDAVRRYLDVLHEDWQRTARYSAKTHEQDPLVEVEHLGTSRLHPMAKRQTPLKPNGSMPVEKLSCTLERAK